AGEKTVIEAGRSLDYEVAIKKNPLVLLSPLEGFIMAFKLSFWIGLILTSPLWIFVIMKFIIPALRTHEKKLVKPLIYGFLLSLTLGISLAYYVTLPLTNRYFEGFNAEIGHNLWSLSHYINFVLLLFFGHAVAFEVGFFLLILVHYGIFSA